MKKGPILLLLVLGFAITFLTGLRIGSGVEKTNKTLSYYLSLPPTKAPEPTALPLGFMTYTHPHCAVSFVMPVSAAKERESSLAAAFKTKEGEVLAISCDKNDPRLIETEKAGTDMLMFRNKKVSTIKTGIYREFTIRNPAGRSIYIKVIDAFLPLLEGSLLFPTP